MGPRVRQGMCIHESFNKWNTRVKSMQYVFTFGIYIYIYIYIVSYLKMTGVSVQDIQLSVFFH